MRYIFFVLFVAIAAFVLRDIGALESTLTFPKGFHFGVSTAAFQIEGAWNEDGKGLSIWDNFSHTPGKVLNNDTGDLACDHYHRLNEDVDIIASLGVSHYRMSLSWPRLFPNGTGKLNDAGVQHYVNEMKLLRSKGIRIMVTLYHWDLPQALQEQGGWLNTTTSDAFVNYANTSFALFGEFVDSWVTFNEPWVISWWGYGLGQHAPGRCSDRSFCAEGDSSTEPYIAGHNILLAHAHAVKLYRENFEARLKAKIGIVLNSDWAEPLSDDQVDIVSAQRYVEFMLGWFADPVLLGDYPASMKAVMKERLPNLTFDSQTSELLKTSSDFIGLNHYTSLYATSLSNATYVPNPHPGWSTDMDVFWTREKNGVIIGHQGDLNWLYNVPWGIRKLLGWIKNRYNNPEVMITENGFSVKGESELTAEEAIHDEDRRSYLVSYLTNVLAAIQEDGCNVSGYFVWSLMDNFEWAEGYLRRFGIVYVDYKNNLKRTLKSSAEWYRALAEYNLHPDTHVPPKYPNALFVLSSVAAGVVAAIAICAGVYFYRRRQARENYLDYTRH
jgi:beta-glucosidase